MTKIEWTDETWNPIAGCTKVSPGCTNCYAEKMARRLQAMGLPLYDGTVSATGHWTGIVNLASQATLEMPLRWKKPRRVFVNSMSDLFHPAVPDIWIDRIFDVMQQAPQHTFQVLTKRPERMAEYVNRRWSLPAPNIWLGTSVENQATANERIPWLVETLAAVRFLSMEPLLGPVWLDHLYVLQPRPLIEWVIVGGESGPGARPMHPDWVRDLRDECIDADVPFFFKQWGDWFPRDQWEDHPTLILPDDDDCYNAPGDQSLYVFREPGAYHVMHRVGKKAAGRLLDGREWSEWPVAA